MHVTAPVGPRVVRLHSDDGKELVKQAVAIAIYM